ncbi:MAG: iron-containing alcohol dehydrogenase [Lachnospiraceae bacterium]|nr:iron-containing alcohol dehydrogenase [Lachnospiraceae bacterium]
MRFTNPRDLYHGKGALEALKTLKGKKAVVCVGGGSMKKFGFLDKACDYLKEAGMEVMVIDGIEPDPSVTTVMNGAAKMLEFEPDWIIAMGGGSPIDAAKAMWIKYEYPECTFEDMCKIFGIPELRKKAKFVAVSSTSGTATEVTAFSIITDYDKGIKYPIADFEITPDVAIVDPELAETMPQKLVAHTGMDAMTHAIESYVSTCACDYTDAMGLYAMKLIKENLVKSYNGDMTARDTMHNAQCLAGIAFSSGLLGIVHSMAHKTGAAFAADCGGYHIIHGAANAMYLPKVIAFNAKDERAAERFAYVADYLGLGGETRDEKIANLIAMLRKMNDDLNIPHCIKNYGGDSYPTEQGFVPEDVFLAKLPDIAREAIGDACTGANPRAINQEEMEALLKCCYYDTEVDF